MKRFELQLEFFNFGGIPEFADAYRRCVEESMKEGRYPHDKKRTESIAVRKREFVEIAKERLRARAQAREVREVAGA